MKRREMLKGMGSGAMLMAGAGAADAMRQGHAHMGPTAVDTTVYELREYHTYEGKLEDLLARFRDHTIAIFKRHGMESVAYWTPTDEPLKGRTLVYVLRHPSREEATANWAAFHADPEWQQVSKASEAKGKLVIRTESTFMKLTSFSPRV
mgnify:CR=1 FL=1